MVVREAIRHVANTIMTHAKDDVTDPTFAPTWPMVRTQTQQRLSIARGFPSSPRFDVESIPGAAFVIGPDARIAAANGRAATLIDVPLEQLSGRSLYTVIVNLDASTAGHARFHGASADVHVIHATGRTIAVDALVCPHDGSSVLIIVRPLERALEGLREHDVARVVSDLKGPLTAIALQLSVLDDHTGRIAVSRGVHQMARDVEVLDRMIEDMLDLCALDLGQLSMRRAGVELSALIALVLERLPGADVSRVRLETTERVTLAIDELRMQRVVNTLIQNALDHAPDRSGIVVRLGVRPPYAVISVIDSGGGIDVTAVFDNHGACSSRWPAGGGVGLYVSKRIVEAHGGRLGVQSIPAVGTRFVVELPLT